MSILAKIEIALKVTLSIALIAALTSPLVFGLIVINKISGM
ncbi:hypothetical protein N5C81_03890 [Rhizobium pusense]|nr:hypothetical protein [Agrobacterium pusense]MDH1266757.1 hypothetical protein [Agrobacterium pusense]